MQRFIVRLVITALAVMLASYLLPEHLVEVRGNDFWSALLFAIVLGVLNAFVRPILLLLTFPLTLLTLGLFTFVVNALVFWLATRIPVGVSVSGFEGAFLGALIVSVVSFFTSRAIR